MAAREDHYASIIIDVGNKMGVSPRGIAIGLSTALVETNIKVYANNKVPDSFNFPHDAVGDDGYSVGIFQQQIRQGVGGRWWWGDTRTCMDPALSARLFFERLLKLDYTSNDNSPGWYAQSVQDSAFPDRYDERMGEAQELYDRLVGGAATVAFDYGVTKVMHGYNSGSMGIGNSDGPRAQTLYVGLHTQQAASTAVNLVNFCNNSANTPNPVAYNCVVDDEDTIELVPFNEGPWAAAAANGIAFHICFAGSFAEWSEGKWLERDASDGLNEDAMLTRGAKAVAAACQEYGIPAVYAGDAGNSGWPVLPKGIVGHQDFGQRGGGHTDPGIGGGFPIEEFIRRVNAFIQNKEQPDMGSFSDEELGKKFPSRSAYRDSGEPIDTLAGIVSNIDARLHEKFVEDQAAQGEQWAIDKLKQVAETGIVGDRTGFDYPGIVEATKAQAKAALRRIGK